MAKKTKVYRLVRLEESDFLVLSSLFKKSYERISKGTSSLPDELTNAVPRIVEALDSSEVCEEVHEISEQPKKSVIKANICSDHPLYGAKRPPRTDCNTCWSAYKRFNPLSYDKARRAFKRKVESAK